jgi:cytochrome bd-type quinol oxidase subunit 1
MTEGNRQKENQEHAGEDAVSSPGNAITNNVQTLDKSHVFFSGYATLTILLVCVFSHMVPG